MGIGGKKSTVSLNGISCIMFLVPSGLGGANIFIFMFFENMGVPISNWGVRYKFIGPKYFINFFLGDHGPIKFPLFFVTLINLGKGN